MSSISDCQLCYASWRLAKCSENVITLRKPAGWFQWVDGNALKLKLRELGPTVCWNTRNALANCRQRVGATRDKSEVDGVARLQDIYVEEKLEAVMGEIRIPGANAEMRKMSNLAYIAFFEMQYKQAVPGGNRKDVADLPAGCREENKADAYTLELPIHVVIWSKGRVTDGTND